MEALNSNRRLLIRPPPETWESLRGYLLRCAEGNSIDHYSRILALAGAKTSLSVHFDLNALAQVLGQDKHTLEHRTYWTPPGKSAKYAQFRGRLIRHYHIEHSGARVCPACLLELGYCRAEWEIKTGIVCPIHKTVLIDACPSCGEKLTWRRRHVGRCNCGANLGTNNPQLADERSVQLAQLIYEKVGAGDPTWRGRYTADIRALPLHDLLELIHVLPTYSLGHGAVTKTQLGRTSADVLAVLFAEAAEILLNWPNGFYNVLDAQRSVSIERNSATTGLSLEFGSFYSALSRRFSESRLRILRKALSEYLINSRCSSYLTSRNKWIKPSDKSQFLSRPQAAVRLGVASQTVDVLLRQGELVGTKTRWGSRTIAFIERSSIDAYKSRQRNVIDSETAATLLGVSKPAYRAMIDDRLLVPHSRIAPRIKKRYEIDKYSIRRLLSKLERNIETDTGSLGISYHKAICRLRKLNRSPSDLVRLALAGNVRVVGVDQSQAGLRRFRYSGSDLQLLTERLIRDQGRTGAALNPFCGSLPRKPFRSGFAQ